MPAAIASGAGEVHAAIVHHGVEAHVRVEGVVASLPGGVDPDREEVLPLLGGHVEHLDIAQHVDAGARAVEGALRGRGLAVGAVALRVEFPEREARAQEARLAVPGPDLAGDLRPGEGHIARRGRVEDDRLLPEAGARGHRLVVHVAAGGAEHGLRAVVLVPRDPHGGRRERHRAAPVREGVGAAGRDGEQGRRHAGAPAAARPDAAEAPEGEPLVGAVGRDVLAVGHASQVDRVPGVGLDARGRGEHAVGQQVRLGDRVALVREGGVRGRQAAEVEQAVAVHVVGPGAGGPRCFVGEVGVEVGHVGRVHDAVRVDVRDRDGLHLEGLVVDAGAVVAVGEAVVVQVAVADVAEAVEVVVPLVGVRNLDAVVADVAHAVAVVVELVEVRDLDAVVARVGDGVAVQVLAPGGGGEGEQEEQPGAGRHVGLPRERAGLPTMMTDCAGSRGVRGLLDGELHQQAGSSRGK